MKGIRSSRRSELLFFASLMRPFLIFPLMIGGCTATSDQSNADKRDSHNNHSSANSNPAAKPTPRIPAYFADPEQAKPFPKVIDPKQFTTLAVVKGYQYATENPELFAQQPCYCYCDAGDQHRSLLDCFATDHGAG